MLTGLLEAIDVRRWDEEGDDPEELDAVGRIATGRAMEVRRKEDTELDDPLAWRDMDERLFSFPVPDISKRARIKKTKSR